MQKATREKFIYFLERTYKGKMTEDERLKEVDFAEDELLHFICSLIDRQLGEIYDCIDKKNLQSIYKLVCSDEAIHQKAELYGENLPKVLKDYISYLDSKIHQGTEKIKVTSRLKPMADNSAPEGEDEPRPEGKVSQVCVTHYERRKEHREAALRKYGYVCQCCKMEFEKVYGEIGKEYIEVHHLDPVSNYDAAHDFDPLDEERGLVPLCSNCHSMIHRGGTDIKHPLSLKELVEIFNSHKHS